MKLCRCPICHSDLTLEALIEDESGQELLRLILSMSHDCGRHAVDYLGLFKPAKSALSNNRALKILQSLLELYPCSNLLAHALAETVESVRKNRREGGRVEPLVNHNYLKKVYESAKPQFAVVRSESKKSELSSQEKQAREAEEKRMANIQYVEHFVRLRGVEACRNLPCFDEWQKWQQEKANATANP